MADIHPNDLVVLISGSPLLKVLKREGDKATCLIMVTKKTCEIPVVCLEVVYKSKKRGLR